MRKKILIYRDYGCDDVGGLVREIKKYFTSMGCEILYTDAAGIKSGDLKENVLALFMPGGTVMSYALKLGLTGNQKISEYVKAGGVYFGLCAGAYYACKKVIFEKDVPELSVVSQNSLSLFEATAVGTLHKEFGIRPYSNDESSAAVAGLLWTGGLSIAPASSWLKKSVFGVKNLLKARHKCFLNKEHFAYYHGGPTFEIGKEKKLKVLAVYKDIKGKIPAVISKKIGKGAAIASGVHFETTMEDVLEGLHKRRIDKKQAKKNAALLDKHENSRAALEARLFELILNRLS